MKINDGQGLITLALVVVIVVAGILLTMKFINLKNEPTGGTPFAQEPPAAVQPTGR